MAGFPKARAWVCLCAQIQGLLLCRLPRQRTCRSLFGAIPRKIPRRAPTGERREALAAREPRPRELRALHPRSCTSRAYGALRLRDVNGA